jgi:hypothetical protein
MSTVPELLQTGHRTAISAFAATGPKVDAALITTLTPDLEAEMPLAGLPAP